MTVCRSSSFLCSWRTSRAALAEITEALAEAGVDIRAISVADTSDFGILRVIVDKPKQAVETLKSHGMTVSLTKRHRRRV